MTARGLVGRTTVFAAVTLAACATERDEPIRTSVVDSAGVEIVFNGAELPTTFETSETLRLGTVDEEGPEQFSEIYAVALGENGEIVVGNNGSGSVRVFDSDGAFLREFGARGDGPGEVVMVNDVFAAGDTVGIIDGQRGGKLILYDLEGTLLDTWIGRQPDGTSILPLRPAPNGWLTIVNRPGSSPRLSPGEVDTVFQHLRLMEFGSSDIGPTVYSVPLYTLYGVDAPGESSMVWPLFRPRVHFAHDAEGRLFVTDDQSYRIDVHDPGGLRRSVRRAHSPRPITPDDVAELEAAVLQVIDTSSRIPDDIRPARRRRVGERLDRQASLPLPEAMTPLADLLVSRDGSFWVRVADPEALVEWEIESMFGMFGGAPPAETDWDLFDSSGHLLGRVTLPARFRAEAVRGREVVGVWTDELDVEYVVRYRVASSAEEIGP